jgi:hypothetical protein
LGQARVEFAKFAREVVRIQLQVFEIDQRPESLGDGAIQPAVAQVDHRELRALREEVVRHGPREAGLGQDQRFEVRSVELSFEVPFHGEPVDLKVPEIGQESRLGW